MYKWTGQSHAKSDDHLIIKNELYTYYMISNLSIIKHIKIQIKIFLPLLLHNTYIFNTRGDYQHKLSFLSLFRRESLINCATHIYRIRVFSKICIVFCVWPHLQLLSTVCNSLKRYSFQETVYYRLCQY